MLSAKLKHRKPINLIFLLDVLFLLLIFFVLTLIKMRFIGEMTITLPNTQSEATAAQQSTPFVVALTQNNIWMIDQQEMDESQVIEKIKNKVHEQPDAAWILMGDTQADFGKAVGLLSKLNVINIRNISIAVNPKGTKG